MASRYRNNRKPELATRMAIRMAIRMATKFRAESKWLALQFRSNGKPLLQSLPMANFSDIWARLTNFGQVFGRFFAGFGRYRAVLGGFFFAGFRHFSGVFQAFSGEIHASHGLSLAVPRRCVRSPKSKQVQNRKLCIGS